ncbi:MAG: pseudouridine synthase [Bacilli bacterium]|nr:pseudouridine synthase [Bacilli bacterium]
MERLQKVIANRGYCSRRKAEELIEQGEVKVNGIIVKELGVKVSENDKIVVSGIELNKISKEYYLLYKPYGVVSTTSDDKGRKTVTDLINTTTRVYPIGRLDYDTTGLILLTNDGEFANILMHPSSEIDKIYVAKIKGIITGTDINKLKSGVEIDGVKTSKAKVKVRSINKKNNTSIVELTIHEGRNHQVKKMFASLNYGVIKLKRTRLAFLNLNDLKEGEYRQLTIKEVRQLYNLANKK